MAEYYSSPYTGKEIDEAIDAVQKKVLHQDLATEQYVLDKVKELQDSVDQTYNPESKDAQSGIAVAQAVSNKVEKVVGKGLSTNDYTDEDKEKVDSNRKTIYVTPDGYIYDKNTREKITVTNANIVKDLYNIDFVYVDTSAGGEGDTYNVPLQAVFGGEPGYNSTIELFGVDKKRNKRLHGEYVVDEYGSTTGDLFVWTKSPYNIENIKDGSGSGSACMGNTASSGKKSFAIGENTSAEGDYSHAEGAFTTASGFYSHAGGFNNHAANYASTVIGQYAKKSIKSATVYDSTGEAFVVGNGSDENNRSNAFEVHFDGTAKLGNKNVATENYVQDVINAAIIGAMEGSY